MRNILCANLLGVINGCHGLERPFRADRKGIGVVSEHVAKNNIFDALLIIFLRHVHALVRGNAQILGAFFDFLQVLFGKAPGVHHHGMYFQTFFHGKVFGAKRSVQPSAKCQCYFFFHSSNFFCLLFRLFNGYYC